MPADSDTPVERTWRPVGPRWAGLIAGALLLVLALTAWWLLPPSVKDDFSLIQKITMVFLTAMAYAAGYSLVRSRVTLAADALVVVNGYKRRDLAWADLGEITLSPGAPWATVELRNGDAVAVMALQGSDGARAMRGVEAIAARINAEAAG